MTSPRKNGVVSSSLKCRQGVAVHAHEREQLETFSLGRKMSQTMPDFTIECFFIQPNLTDVRTPPQNTQHTDRKVLGARAFALGARQPTDL